MSNNKILVIDDEKETLELVVDYLSDYYLVSSSISSSNALQMIADMDFDMILLDINMPIFNGFELCKKIKSISGYEDVPLIFISALSDLEKIEMGFELGAVDYIVKPFKLQELKLRINRHLMIAKKQKELIQKQVDLNEQIRQLTNELMNGKEDDFASRENNFSANYKRIKETKQKNEDFNIKLKEIQLKLENQRELLIKTKMMLS